MKRAGISLINVGQDDDVNAIKGGILFACLTLAIVISFILAYKIL